MLRTDTWIAIAARFRPFGEDVSDGAPAHGRGDLSLESSRARRNATKSWISASVRLLSSPAGIGEIADGFISSMSVRFTFVEWPGSNMSSITLNDAQCNSPPDASRPQLLEVALTAAARSSQPDRPYGVDRSMGDCRRYQSPTVSPRPTVEDPSKRRQQHVTPIEMRSAFVEVRQAKQRRGYEQ